MHDKTSESNGSTRKFGRRNFLTAVAAGAGGIGLGAALAPYEERVAYATRNVNRNSAPSSLKITDLRVAVLDEVPFTSPIVRIDTNQGISGYGEVRDDADPRYALMLKSRLLGQNPTSVEKLFAGIQQFGGHGRQGGGVSGVEMALWDLAGKAFGVPVYQMIGGKYRDDVRLYTDTAASQDPAVYARRMKEKVDREGFTFLKMDVGIELIKDIPGALTGAGAWGDLEQYSGKHGSYGMTEHPFTRIQITDKGLDEIAKYYEAVRNAVGYEIPLGSDHFGHFGVNEAIKLSERMAQYNLAYMEDLVPWFHTDMWKEISRATTVPTMTGEDIYGLEDFKPLIDERAVDLVHPDIASAGGIMPTKEIGDYAAEHGIAMFLHYAGSPIGAMASAHVAVASHNFVALENHSAEVEFWDDLVTGVEKPLVRKGFYRIPDGPGLGVELNEEAARQHLKKDTELFPPSDQWNESGSWDRTWS
ncbi:mandelate racemase/muconate lactonizing enzyme family protein [Saccharopolyspora sp. CA-218241]|uniref:mandelate racemase/muconate lactonizing enzyme family protein n=1 Tax=Saccharopolyspora sp. CA-218241 TaxID=3240027 RepID=UPI003D97F597